MVEVWSDPDVNLFLCALKGDLIGVRYWVQHGADMDVDDSTGYSAMGLAVVLHHAHVRRYLQRVAFSDYMRSPKQLYSDKARYGCEVYIMPSSHTHHASLLQAIHKTMGRCTAMDVQHMVVEMLVGASVMKYFRSRSAQ